jgi:pimeloyl-ACP methyl ester carboxylesterase
MTRFLDLRHDAIGGGLVGMDGVATFEATAISNYTGLRRDEFVAALSGRDLLIVSHGFNVDRQAGIACLSNWERLLTPQLPANMRFVGLLWPGDSTWAHGLDYPEEPRMANDSGALLAAFLDTYLGEANSISFISHSLGARVVLETIARLSRPVRAALLMAPAIDDNCLNTEFRAAAKNTGQIAVLSSKMDHVLGMDFPLGNFLAGIIAAGHPWWRAALGHCGPVQPLPESFLSPHAIPDGWAFDHGDYLHIDAGPPPPISPDALQLAPHAPLPGNGQPGWQEAFTAFFAAQRCS